MFSICKQTHQPTGVEHALSCFFFNKTEKSLVTASTNILKVFRLIPDVDQKARHERYSGLYTFAITYSFALPNLFCRILSAKIEIRMYGPVSSVRQYHVDAECYFGKLSKGLATAGFLRCQTFRGRVRPRESRAKNFELALFRRG